MDTDMIGTAALAGALDTQKEMVGTLLNGSLRPNSPNSGLPDGQTQDLIRSATGLGNKLDAVV